MGCIDRSAPCWIHSHPSDSGWLQKAVRFDGEEGRIIEELQLFQTPQPVNFLQLSTKTVKLKSLVTSH